VSTSTSFFRSGSVVWVTVLAFGFAAAACSGKRSGQPGSGGAAGGGTGGSAAGAGGATGGKAGKGSGGAAGSGGSAGEGGKGGGMQDDRPVLERPVRADYSCAVTTPIDDTGVDWAGGDLASTPSGAFLAWGRPATTAATDGVMLASVDEAGTVGTSSPIATYAGSYSSRPRLTRSPRGLSVAWTQAGMNEMSSLHIAELDTTGAVTSMPRAVAGIAERIADLALAPAADGNALLFVHTAVDYSSMAVRFARLDADGALDGNLVDVSMVQAQGQMQSGELVAVPGGFAATTTTWTGAEFETHLVFLNDGGAVQGDPILLSDGRPFLGQSLLVRGGELIVARVDEVGSYDQSNIARFATLSRFDLETRERSAPDVRVQSPTVNEEVVNPVLFAVGDDVGLIWSRGSVIYICAGCMPDNHLEAVVMDGDDFTPLTEMLTFPNEQPMGGYIRPLVAPVGEHFAVVTQLFFHVSGNMATGAFQCTPAP
jgi:hypothetical protein